MEGRTGDDRPLLALCVCPVAMCDIRSKRIAIKSFFK
eukprot:CAMPEP_0197496644 /NCGR_PEP_ID=MMETSP1311-20131121/45987_1 /TAXON_ID=464262 /ORGANISM="Genus nov. species nov., Strain RCC856" /LENGTH=36 /DNA_ID= /DNA_START= /DNA_END= /DNA_ORIENTATION=